MAVDEMEYAATTARIQEMSQLVSALAHPLHVAVPHWHLERPDWRLRVAAARLQLRRRFKIQRPLRHGRSSRRASLFF